MQVRKPVAVTAAVFVVAGQVAGAAVNGEIISADVPVTSLSAVTTANSTGITSFNIAAIADTMLDVMRDLPPPDIPGLKRSDR